MNFCIERTRTVAANIRNGVCVSIEFLSVRPFIHFFSLILYFIMKLYQSSIGAVHANGMLFLSVKNEHETKILILFCCCSTIIMMLLRWDLYTLSYTRGKNYIFRIKSPKKISHTRVRKTDSTDWFSRVHTFPLWRSFFSQFFFLNLPLLAARFLCKAEKWWIHTVPTKFKYHLIFFCGMSVCLFALSRATFKSIEFTVTCVEKFTVFILKKHQPRIQSALTLN